ncbi:MAG: ribosome-binding factor A [Kofleriaceae bacterium]|nr:ribosome-binding factor A [Kofleriaceae bacterium]
MPSHDHGGRSGRHKDLQVCRQVYDALTWALAELDDPLIDELSLASVDPAPDASRVLVTLVPVRPGVDLDAALAAVREQAGELREDVAAEVHRRRAPELVFRVALPDEHPDVMPAGGPRP